MRTPCGFKCVTMSILWCFAFCNVKCWQDADSYGGYHITALVQCIATQLLHLVHFQITVHSLHHTLLNPTHVSESKVIEEGALLLVQGSLMWKDILSLVDINIHKQTPAARRKLDDLTSTLQLCLDESDKQCGHLEGCEVIGRGNGNGDRNAFLTKKVLYTKEGTPSMLTIIYAHVRPLSFWCWSPNPLTGSCDVGPQRLLIASSFWQIGNCLPLQLASGHNVFVNGSLFFYLEGMINRQSPASFLSPEVFKHYGLISEIAMRQFSMAQWFWLEEQDIDGEMRPP